MKTSASFDDLGRREQEFQQITSRRNALEYLAGGSAAAVFLVIGILVLRRAGSTPDFMLAAGFVMLAAGLLLAGWHLFRNSRPADGQRAAPGCAAPRRDRLRQRLERERKLLANAWLWYTGPLLPGFALIYLGYWLASPGSPAMVLVSGGLTLVFLIAVAFINRYAARKLDREIQDLQ